MVRTKPDMPAITSGIAVASETSAVRLNTIVATIKRLEAKDVAGSMNAAFSFILMR